MERIATYWRAQWWENRTCEYLPTNYQSPLEPAELRPEPAQPANRECGVTDVVSGAASPPLPTGSDEEPRRDGGGQLLAFFAGFVGGADHWRAQLALEQCRRCSEEGLPGERRNPRRSGNFMLIITRIRCGHPPAWCIMVMMMLLLLIMMMSDKA